jgi:hypothetical protein
MQAATNVIDATCCLAYTANGSGCPKQSHERQPRKREPPAGLQMQRTLSGAVGGPMQQLQVLQHASAKQRGHLMLQELSSHPWLYVWFRMQHTGG